MTPETITLFNNLIVTVKSAVVGYMGFFMVGMVGLVVAVFAIRWGWGSIMGIMKSDGKIVTFGSPLGYHGKKYKTLTGGVNYGGSDKRHKGETDDEYYGRVQNSFESISYKYKDDQGI